MAKKQKKVVKQPEENKEEPTKKGKGTKKDDNDRFYDLDDDFIDDGDIEEADYGAALGGGGFNLNHDFYNYDENDRGSEAQDPKADADQEIEMLDDQEIEAREEQKYQQVINRFKVLLPADIDRMLNQ